MLVFINNFDFKQRETRQRSFFPFLKKESASKKSKYPEQTSGLIMPQPHLIIDQTKSEYKNIFPRSDSCGFFNF